MARVKLPPGFRFHPTDVELVTYYLNRKVHGRAIEFDIVAEVDLYKCEPWDLPDKSLIASSDAEWYFFSARDKKYANGSRTNRATEAGYWKATGKDRTVKTGTRKVGMKKTLVFYKGRAPHGERTNWVMHEYRLEEDEPGKKLQAVQDAFVLCRVFKKSGIGPKNPEHNSASLDMEEVETTTIEDESVPDEKPPASKLQVAPFSPDALTKERAFMDSEMKTVADDNAKLGVPPETCNTQEASDIDSSMLYAMLLNDPNQSLDASTMVNGSTSELARSDTLPTQSSSSLITDEDLDLWLQEPDLSGMLTASTSANQVNLADYYSPDEADMLNELYRSTLPSQESKVAAQNISESLLESKYLVRMPTSPKTMAEDVYDLSELDGYVFNNEFSSLSEQKPLEEGQAFSSKTLNGSEEALEEDILEEMLQLIKEGQQSQVNESQSQEKGASNGLEDVYFDTLEELNVDEWMKGNLLNEAFTSHLEVKDALEPSSSHIENWFNTSLVSASDLPSVLEGLPDFSNSGLSMQTLHNSFQAQEQTELQSGREHAISPLADLTSTKDHVSYMQDSTSKPSKPLSRFSKLLDSVPVLPASAAEYPLIMHKPSFESKDSLITNPGKSLTSMQTTAWNACITGITFRCSCEFMSGVWRSSALEGRPKQQILMSKDKAKSSIKAPVYHIQVPKNSDRDGCFARRGNGCFSLMFFLGALSAVCWFLLLRMSWRLAIHMGSLLV